MIELSNERIEEILHKENGKTEELTTILRGIYTRYMRLYERYYADIDALNNNQRLCYPVFDNDLLTA